MIAISPTVMTMGAVTTSALLYVIGAVGATTTAATMNAITTAAMTPTGVTTVGVTTTAATMAAATNDHCDYDPPRHDHQDTHTTAIALSATSEAIIAVSTTSREHHNSRSHAALPMQTCPAV